MTMRTTTVSTPASALAWVHEPLLGLTIRELLKRLTVVEDELRGLRQRDGRTPEGEQAQLEHYGRRLCEELRRRRR